MNYVLYYAPGTASMAVHWMLLELDAPFEARLVDFERQAQRDPEYLRLNPSGRVPTLIVEDTAVAESAAILMLLAERHPDQSLAPRVDEPGRAAWLSMMIYLANTLLPAMRDWFYADIDGAPQGAEAVRALAQSRIEAAWARLEGEFADGRTFLGGDHLQTTDFLAVMLMRWSRNMPRPATRWPGLAAYAQRLTQRPAWLELNRREALSDWPPEQTA